MGQKLVGYDAICNKFIIIKKIKMYTLKTVWKNMVHAPLGQKLGKGAHYKTGGS